MLFQIATNSIGERGIEHQLQEEVHEVLMVVKAKKIIGTPFAVIHDHLVTKQFWVDSSSFEDISPFTLVFRNQYVSTWKFLLERLPFLPEAGRSEASGPLPIFLAIQGEAIESEAWFI